MCEHCQALKERALVLLAATVPMMFEGETKKASTKQWEMFKAVFDALTESGGLIKPAIIETAAAGHAFLDTLPVGVSAELANGYEALEGAIRALKELVKANTRRRFKDGEREGLSEHDIEGLTKATLEPESPTFAINLRGLMDAMVQSDAPTSQGLAPKQPDIAS